MTGRLEFFRRSMGFLAICFFVGGFLFLIFPDRLIQVTNWIPRGEAPAAPLVSLPPLSQAPPRLWPILSFTMMMMITTISALVWLDPKKYQAFVPLVLFSKACSSLTSLLVYWIAGHGYVADILGLFVDLPIFLFILIAYLRARPELAEPRPIA
jgi:hypothetical protein